MQTKMRPKLFLVGRAVRFIWCFNLAFTYQQTCEYESSLALGMARLMAKRLCGANNAILRKTSQMIPIFAL
jgi:hypothetical protein